MHSLVVHLAQIPAQLAVVLSPIAFRRQLHFHRFLPTVGSDQHAVWPAARTALEPAGQVACRRQLVAQQLPFRDSARLPILVQHPGCHLDDG